MPFVHKGWIESKGPESGKAVVLLEYRLLNAAECGALLKSPDYAHTHVTGPLAQSMAAIFSVTPDQLSQRGVLFCSQEPLKEGQELELTVTVPKWKTRLRVLGRIGSIHLDQEMREVVFSAWLHLSAAHQADLKRLTDAIDKSKGR